MTTTAIRLSDETITALAQALDLNASALNPIERHLDPEAQLAFQMGVLKLTRAASDIVPAETASRRKIAARTAPLCPECLTGKHGNCDGLTWDALLDDAVACPCLAIGPAGLELHPQIHSAHAEFVVGCLPCAHRQLGTSE